MGNNYADRTHCKNGHEYTVENTRWRKEGGRDCRQCKKERKAAARIKNLELARAKERAWTHNQRARKTGDTARLVRTTEAAVLAKSDDDKVTAVWNQLAPKGDLRKKLDRLQAILNKKPTPCKRKPHLYSEYAEAPSAEEAKDMCRGCPALLACRAYGFAEQKAQREKGLELAGIYGGLVIENE